MTAETITLTLPHGVVPLMLDPLHSTLHTWQATEEYEASGYTPYHIIINCQNEQQAKLMVALHEMIIGRIQQQL